MRINEILLEFKLDIDSQTYGYWIDPNSKAHEVEYQGHLDFLDKMWPDGNERYMRAYNEGWVRMVTTTWEVSIKGYKRDIKKNWSRIARNLKDYDVDKVVFDVLRDDAEGNGDYYFEAFRLPLDRAKLAQFINS